MSADIRGWSTLLIGAASGVLLPAAAHGALAGRDIAGFAVATNDLSCVFIHDTDLNVTWLRDWSFATTSGYTANGDGRLVWGNAGDPVGTQSAQGYMAYLNSLNAGAGYGGVTGWRLPTADLSVPDSGAFNATGGEIGHLWYVELGNPANSVISNAGPFLNMNTTNVNLASWTGDLYAANTNQAWNFRTSQGYQFHDSRGNIFQTPAVVSGDVPAPGAMGLAVIGAAMGARRRRR